MDARSSVFYLGLPLGTWFRTQVRISLFFPLLVLVAVHELGLPLGAAVSGLLLLTVVIHEFSHVLAARLTGGDGDEILIWPMGGLAYLRPAPGFASEFWIPAAGPLSHVVQGLVCLLGLLLLGESAVPAFHLWLLPAVDLSAGPAAGLLLLALSLNIKLLDLNLLPAPPLDGAGMLLPLAKTRWEPPTARRGCLMLAQIVAILVALVGVLRDDTFTVFLAFLLMSVSLHEFFQLQLRELASEAGLPWEGDAGDFRESAEPRPGLIARWRQQRAEQRRLREMQERQDAERQLDLLLDKVHREGMQSLSDAERRFLKQASARYRRQEH